MPASQEIAARLGKLLEAKETRDAGLDYLIDMARMEAENYAARLCSQARQLAVPQLVHLHGRLTPNCGRASRTANASRATLGTSRWSLACSIRPMT